MADTDPDKLEAALEQLEVEKARRLQERVDSGEVVTQTVTVVCTRDEDVEDACERALANLPTSTPDERPIHHDLIVVVTGVPRDPAFGQWMSPKTVSSEEGNTSRPSEELVGSGSAPSQPTQTYVRIIVRNGEDGDPGQITEAFYTVEDGSLVLRDRDDKHLTSRALLKDENPATLARILLREREAPKDFQLPIHYPKLGLA